jgi:hypothetical protein
VEGMEDIERCPLVQVEWQGELRAWAEQMEVKWQLGQTECIEWLLGQQ